MTSTTATVGVFLCIGLGAADLAYLNLSLAPALIADSAAPVAEPRHPEPPAPAPAPPSDTAILTAAAPVADTDIDTDTVADADTDTDTDTDADTDTDTETDAPIPTTDVLYFGKSRATLGPQARDTLDAAAATLGDDDRLRVTLTGHTDLRGDDELNDRLSLRRADRAADYLADRGVDRMRMDVLAFGRTRPADPGTTPDAHQRNRRVEIQFSRRGPRSNQ